MITGPNACPHCNGYVADIGDGLGNKCWNCGRSPDVPPTSVSLNRFGSLMPSREMAGRRGPKNAREYNPSPVGLVRPLAPWRR